jgi:hypothetical protein
MNDNDRESFANIMNLACQSLNKPGFTGDALELYYNILAEHSFDDVQKALFKALSDEESKFGITPALIVKHLGVRQKRPINWQDVIEMARKPTTPLGVLARIHIKSHYLNNYENLAIKHRADTFLDGLEEMKARALAGDYTQHEIVCMIDHKVKVSSPFMEGMPSIGDNSALRAKYDKALHSPQHLENVARQASRERAGIATDRQGQLRIANELKKLSESISVDNDNV